MLAGTRHHLEKAGLSLDQWRTTWTEARFWFGCAGNAGKVGGNPCLTLTRGQGGHWYLTVSVPKPVADAKGRLRTYLRVSWVGPPPKRSPSRRPGLVGWSGVDLNADHLAATRVDVSGNPVGRPSRVPLELAGGSSKTRDGRLRAAITAVLEHAKGTGATAVAVEDLDFADSKDREKLGRKKAFRHLIAGFPTMQFKDPGVAMAATQGLAVIAVDPRYTSRYGSASWQRALTTPTVVATRHEGADRCLGRDRTPGPRARPHHPHRHVNWQASCG